MFYLVAECYWLISYETISYIGKINVVMAWGNETLLIARNGLKVIQINIFLGNILEGDYRNSQ